MLESKFSNSNKEEFNETRNRSRSFEYKLGNLPKSDLLTNNNNIGSLESFRKTTPNHQKKASRLTELKNDISTKYNVSWLSKNENNRIYDIKLELPNQCTVKDAIIQTIKYLNLQLKMLENEFILKEDPFLYDLYYSKKNGLPKEDYPCIEYNQILNQTQIQNFCLIEKNENNIKNTMKMSSKYEIINEIIGKKHKNTDDNSENGREEEINDQKFNSFFCFCIPTPKKQKKKTLQK